MSALSENCRSVQGRGRLGWRRFGVVLPKILGKNGKPPLRVLSGPQFAGNLSGTTEFSSPHTFRYEAFFIVYSNP